MNNTDQGGSRMITDLPDLIKNPKKAYRAPAHIIADPGDLLAYTVAACYGRDVKPLCAHFDVSRQVFWIWRCHGKGIPAEYRDLVQQALDDPNQPFRLPTNATIDDLIREERRISQPTTTMPARRNNDLLELLDRICTSADPHFGRAALPKIISTMTRTVSNPFIFYRWGYVNGGVPRSYLKSFITSLMERRVYLLYNVADHDRHDWEAWARDALAAEPMDEDEYHKEE